MTVGKMWFHGKYSLGVYLYTRLVFVNHMPLKTTDQCNRRVKKKKKTEKVRNNSSPHLNAHDDKAHRHHHSPSEQAHAYIQFPAYSNYLLHHH
jgi:hypothetical protein